MCRICPLKSAWIGLLISVFLCSSLFSSSFELRPLKVFAEPGDSGVKVPIILSSSDPVEGWLTVMSFDTTAGDVTGVLPADSIQAVDPEGDTLAWFFASWAGRPDWRPDYLTLWRPVHGYSDHVAVQGLMELMPHHIPPVPAGDDILLYCLVFDVADSWDFHDVLFSFQTYDCSHNGMMGLGGYGNWGPDTILAAPGTCPERADSFRVIRLTSGVGIGRLLGVEEQDFGRSQPCLILEQNSPNPFSHSTAIHYSLAEEASVSLAVWDVRGTLQRALVDGSRPAPAITP